jgi:hypothetical protein
MIIRRDKLFGQILIPDNSIVVLIALSQALIILANIGFDQVLISMNY